MDFNINKSEIDEAAGIYNWQQFVSHLPKEHRFKQISNWLATGQGNHIDIYVHNTTGGTETWENKCRSITTLTYNDLYIEPEKLNGNTNVYVNYLYNEDEFEGWKFVILAIIPSIPKDKIMYKGKVYCRNSQRMEPKYAIPFDCFYIFKFDGKQMIEWATPTTTKWDAPVDEDYTLSEWSELCNQRIAQLNERLENNKIGYRIKTNNANRKSDN